jgi:hypothetical protein
MLVVNKIEERPIPIYMMLGSLFYTTKVQFFQNTPNVEHSIHVKLLLIS